MDTKLKRYNDNKTLRALVFFVCVILFLGGIAGSALVVDKSSVNENGFNIDEVMLYESYKESPQLQGAFSSKLENLLYMLESYKSEQYIKSGATITEDRMEQAISDLFYNYEYDYVTDEYEASYDNPEIQKKFKEENAAEINDLKQSMIMDDLRSFEDHRKDLEEEGFLYYATDGTYVISNVKGTLNQATSSAIDVTQFSNAPAYLAYSEDNLSKEPKARDGINGSMKYFDESLESRLDEAYEPELKVYFSFDENYMNNKEKDFAAAKAEFLKWLPGTIASVLISFVALVYLVVTTGRKDEDGNVRFCKGDKIYTEFKLIIIAGLLFGGGSLFLQFLLGTMNYGVSYYGDVYVSSDPLFVSIGLATVIGLTSAIVGLYFILSCIRDIKGRRFLRNSIIYKLLRAVWEGIKALYNGGSLMRKVVLGTLGVCVLSATVFLAPIVAALIIAFAPRLVKKFEALKKGVDEVKNGNLAYKIEIQGDGELEQLARGINQISEASNIAIQNELRNQRMKTDLISNVSHDIKTPLTSIINYVDLLKREGLDSENAPKYLDILDQKSIRLKKLTEDLFDAAKASSGAIPVRFEKVDMLSLINQGLGEMSDKVENSNLEFKINAPKNKYYVRADGQLLWRVVENLLGNIFKYAQEGSRVYIDLKEQESQPGRKVNVVLELKNISKTELNINAEELMERFKRGDESRTTEGSGLGLAIAKDLVKLQNGQFDIVIDGDLFKAVVILEAYENQE